MNSRDRALPGRARPRHRPLAALLALLPLAAPALALAQALPFLAPGDSRLRVHVELDGDEGRIPLSTTWPLPTADLPVDERAGVRGYHQPGSAADAGWFIEGAARATRLRTFSDTPRADGEVGLQGGWAAGDYAGGALKFGYAFSPADGMHYRFDGSYVAWRFGNWWVTAGVQDRWWGPGWDGSLILSNNARPMPGIGLERASSEPPPWALLRWVGPWRFVTFVDHMETRRPDFGNTLFWGARLTFAPAHGLEIGLSRTAEFCGSHRPCGLHTLFDVLTAKSNRTINALPNPTPAELLQKESAQRIAWDLRWHPGQVPFAVYWQQYGEVFDSGNYRPRQLLELFGLEFGSWRVGDGHFLGFLEYAGTTCGDIGFTGGDRPQFGCAYEKDTWRAGYRFRGRAIGDAMDRDGRRVTLGGILTDSGTDSLELRLRHFDLNRGGIAQTGLVPQTVTTVPERLWNAELKYDAGYRGLRYSVGVGLDHGGPVGAPVRWSGRGFLGVSREW